jgi:hypothetical protein
MTLSKELNVNIDGIHVVNNGYDKYLVMKNNGAVIVEKSSKLIGVSCGIS